MFAVDKVTKRSHAYCPVLGGYQVCVIPGMEWKDTNLSLIAIFTDEQFHNRFDA